MSTLERPGLARTDRGVSRPLRAWLSRALSDDLALDELALAWREHPLPERRQLVSLFHRDVADAEGVDPSRAQALFASMLALEDDAVLQAELLSTLRALEPPVGAFVYGNATSGGAALCRSTRANRWECLVLDWSEGTAQRVEQRTVDAPTSHAAVASIPSEPRSDQEAWQEVSAHTACDRLALPLLRFRRGGGQLPAGSERFASVISRG